MMSAKIEDGLGNGGELPAAHSRLLLQGDADGARLSEVFRQAPAFMCVLRDPAHVFEMANDRYFQLVGHRDILGKPVREALPEVDGQGYFELLDQVYRTGESVSGNAVPVLLARLPGQPPEERYVDFVYQALRDADGIVTGLVIVGVDVTDRQQAEDRLRKSEVQRRLALDAGEMGSWNIEVGSNTLSCDKRFQRLFGGQVGPITFEEAFDLIHPEDRSRVREAVAASMRPDNPAPYLEEYRVVHPDGSIWWLRGKGRASFEPDGAGRRLASLDGTVVDITAQREAEAKLQQNEQFSRSLMDGTADCVKVLDLHGRLLHMNAPGLSAMEIDDFGPLCGQDWDATWPAEARGDIARSMARAANGEVSSFEAYCPTAKGTPKWWDVTVSPVRDADGGQIVRLLAVSREITARRKVDQALSDSEARLRAATAAVSDLIWTNNADGLMDGEQRGWMDFTGQSREEYEGYGWSNAVHPEDAQPTMDAWARAVAEKRTFVFEHRLRRSDGEWRLCSVRAVPILTAENTIREWVGVHTDITERKRDEEQLRHLAAELSESSHRKDEFLATLAHELRNPLAPIRTGLEVMKLAHGQEATIEKARSMVERQVAQMVRLVDDLMDVSRISRGTLELRREPVLLATVLDSAVETSRPLIEQMGQELIVTLPTQPLVVDADMTRLAQVFMNLLNNAAKYGDSGSRIHLSVKRLGDEAVVTVTDSGIGIAADQLPRIFDIFTQLDGALEKSQGGLGIGLSLVKRLVELHGGKVEAMSEGPGKGCEFVVRLPIATRAWNPQEQSGGDAEPSSHLPLRILVVDDNRDGADSLFQMLNIMGHEARTAYDGQEGVDMAGEFRPDLVLLDIGLPTLDGYEVCRLIRETSWGKDVVLIAVTGWGQDEDRRRSQDAGFDLHLVKPVDPQLLIETITRLQVEKQ